MSDDILRKGETLKQYESRMYKNIPGAAKHLENKRKEINHNFKSKALDKAKESKPKEKLIAGKPLSWHLKDLEYQKKRLCKK